MSRNFAFNWWALLLRSLAAISLGVLAVVWRGLPLSRIELIFFGYAMIDGLLNLAGAISSAQLRQKWGLLALEGLIGIAAAVAGVAVPGVTAVGLIDIIGAWGLATGAVEIAAALRTPKRSRGRSLLTLAGIASLVLGAFMVALSLSGRNDFALWLAAYALLFGALLAGLAFLLRPQASRAESHRTVTGEIHPV
ncbi:MAG TPA: DUF308 domain-containing protein [Candidatus Sulfopaludibacter sp.]|jgi:uncharacterized membrane protein HdeD (DUF308 family)|nr:DUF308 domain-containing protein [Candidatus Sulfopaludibacter sp.]